MSTGRRENGAQSTRLYELPSPFPGEPGVIKLHEPPWCDSDLLAARLVEGEYDKPFVLEHAGVRSLYFGSLRFQQSAMQLASPHALDVAYTQAMMAFMLFNARPRTLALFGLGGGSLAKFCHRHLPGTNISAIEIDPAVIAFRDEFCLPRDDERFRVICADAVEHVAASEERTDVMLVDVFDEHGVAEVLAESSFYADACDRLSGNGIMVLNVAGDKRSCARHVDRLCGVFEDRVLAMSVREDGNYLLFAFRNRDFAPRWKWMSAIARELQTRTGLDFPHFAQALERGQALRLLQRMVA